MKRHRTAKYHSYNLNEVSSIDRQVVDSIELEQLVQDTCDTCIVSSKDALPKGLKHIYLNVSLKSAWTQQSSFAQTQ